jgi:hypothetical protein
MTDLVSVPNTTELGTRWESRTRPSCLGSKGIPVAYLTHRLRSHRRWEVLRHIVLTVAVASETTLLLIALVPANEWARLGESADPIPATLAPIVAALFYLLPALTGVCCRRWQMAVVLATLPVWLDLGIFVVAASGRTGPFYIAQAANSGGVASTFELFAALGAFGWLVSFVLSGAREQRALNPPWRMSDRRLHTDTAYSDES